MDLESVFEEVKTTYFEEVKTLIDEGSFSDAYKNLGALIIRRVYPSQARIKKYHSGPSFIVSIESLFDTLESISDVHSDCSIKMRYVEMCMNQLELAIKTGRRF